jgi:hypothetical protein
MEKIVPLPKRSGRRLGETVYTESGLRLPANRVKTTERWFIVAVVALPALAFLTILLW